VAKNSGVVRAVDDIGRIVIPKEYRTSLGISDGENLEMTLKGDKIEIRKYSKSCVFCGDIADEFILLSKPICGKCRQTLREQVQGIG